VEGLWFSFPSQTAKVPTPTMSRLVKALHCASNTTSSSHLRNLPSFAFSTSSSSSSAVAVDHRRKSSLSNLGQISPDRAQNLLLFVCIIAKIVMKNKSKKCLIPLLWLWISLSPFECILRFFNSLQIHINGATTWITHHILKTDLRLGKIWLWRFKNWNEGLRFVWDV